MPLCSCGLGRDIPLRELYSPREAEHILSCSHPTLYRLIAVGKLDARKIGSKTVITRQSIEQFIAALPRCSTPEASGRVLIKERG